MASRKAASRPSLTRAVTRYRICNLLCNCVARILDGQDPITTVRWAALEHPVQKSKG
jgi:hypothetical protein